MSFQLLLETARSNILECVKSSPETFDNQRYICNPTNFENHMLHPWSEPFIGQIYFLNYYVFTTASTNWPWERGGLHQDNNMAIYFYIPNHLLDDLKKFCNENNLKLELAGYDELEQIGKNIEVDFTSLSKELTHICVSDTDETSSNLYLTLLNYFNSLNGCIYAEVENHIHWFLKNDFYEILEEKINNDKTIRYGLVLLNKLKQHVKIFYHSVYKNDSRFRLGVSREILEKLLTMKDFIVHVLDWKAPEKCDYHITLLPRFEYNSVKGLSRILSVLL